MKIIVAVSSLLWILVVSSQGDETVTGKLTVDQNASATALEVKGGGSGSLIATFIRDVGSDVNIDIHASNAEPQLRFDRSPISGSSWIWSMGLKNDNSFAIARSSALSNETNEYLLVDSAGNIGMGADPPSDRRLKVYYDSGGTYSSAASFQTPYSYYGFGDVELRFVSTITSGSSHMYLEDMDNSDSRFLIEALGNAGTVDAFLVTSSGKVGIGTRSPTNALEVNGTVRSKEVIVETTGWPDYVFEEDYNLPTLDEVETHIQSNGHLPGIAPASEFNTKGQSLGETQRLMMQKIEELTLYVIKLKKENDEQQREIEALKKRNVIE